ncbi:mucin-5AC-like isoform X3 [Homarus americanus]|uniref:mucin-5AC-like isoform X3 n=1 Tax=Homarus americanus TaxID=6706 RepID=UPI001C47EC7E|nr:mucin-5AC-like isoform X3 [Homarus americanus]
MLPHKMMWAWCVLMGGLVGVGALPIVDPGLFVIQGVSSCFKGSGYCLLGNNCTVDIDFRADNTGGHCRGLRDAFTPKIDFVCCQYNPLGKATSEPPTTTLSSYTITDVFSLIEQDIINQQQEELDIDNLKPENLIDIVGVVTDFTGIIDLVTRPWTGTIPTRASTPTTTPLPPPTTPSPPPSPATPTDPQLILLSEEDSEIDQPEETTESYHEIPTTIKQSSVAEGNDQSSTEANVLTTTKTQAIDDTTTTSSLDLTSTQTTIRRPPPPPPPSSTLINSDNMNVIFLPHLSFQKKPSTGEKQPPEGQEKVTDTQVIDGSDNTDAIVFPDESPAKNPPSTVETQALEEVTETQVINGLDNSDAIVFPDESPAKNPPSTVETQALEEITETQVINGLDNSDVTVFPDESPAKNPPSTVETQALEEVTETLVLTEEGGETIPVTELESNSVQDTQEPEVSTTTTTEGSTVEQVTDQSVGETVPSQGVIVVGELPEVTQVNGETPEVTQVNGEIPEVTQVNGETPEVTQVNGEIPEVTQVNGEIPEVTQVNGEIPEVTQVNGEIPEVTHVNGEIPGVTHVNGEIPGTVGTGEEESGVVGPGGEIPGVEGAGGNVTEVAGSNGEAPGVVGTNGQESGVIGVGGEDPGMGEDFPGGEEPTDYDYYSNYPDQLLLQPVNQNICGFKGLKNYIPDPSSSRILGGLVASTVEWCWVAAIMERRQGGNKYVCSGALVESNLVVSTATCLRRLNPRNLSRYVVVLGDSNLQEDLPYGLQFHSLAEVVTHPDYFTSGGAHANDIGVIRLVDHATLSHNVCLVCMAQQDAIFPAQTCIVTGYGIGHVPYNMITDVKDVVPSDGVLRQLSVPLLKKGECRAALQNVTGSTILASSDSFLCAGGLDHASACYSTMDGGSPLACEVGGRWFVAGLVSWSKDCTVPGTPNVYTRMTSFTSWLQATYLRMLGFLTQNVYSNKQRWMHQHVHDVNKEFA